MTSLSTIGPEQQHLEGRTVRDIVEYSPEQVNEVWCRKIFRQILQSLELQYAMHMPHRPITPDTVVFHDNGEPLLLPAPGASAEGSEAEDLGALARVVHYAITRELAPTGPLRGRAPEGYSDSLVTAVDRCMAPDPDQRPHSIEELRNLLGIVPLGPAIPAPPLFDDADPAPATTTGKAAADAAALPSFMQDPATPRKNAGLSRWQRWAVAAGGGAVLLALALALFAEMRDTSSFDHIVLTLPQQGEGGQRGDAPAAAPPQVADSGNAASAPAPAPISNAPGATGTAAATDAPVANAPLPVRPAPAAPPAQPGRAAGAPAAPKGGAAYKLRIQPWGIVYVDGVDRGVSPPVKRLVLAPGKHTIRVTNPNFHDRVLEVDTAGGDGQIAVDFSDDAQ